MCSTSLILVAAGRTMYDRLLRVKLIRSTAGSFMSRLRQMSCATSGVAVAVRASTGAWGAMARNERMLR